MTDYLIHLVARVEEDTLAEAALCAGRLADLVFGDPMVLEVEAQAEVDPTMWRIRAAEGPA